MKNEKITYKWTGNKWIEVERAIMNRVVVRDMSEARPRERSRPCWWHNGVKEVQSVEAPDGWFKGRLPAQYRSVKRRHPCMRCGRAFYIKRDFLSHDCINAK